MYSHWEQKKNCWTDGKPCFIHVPSIIISLRKYWCWQAGPKTQSVFHTGLRNVDSNTSSSKKLDLSPHAIVLSTIQYNHLFSFISKGIFRAESSNRMTSGICPAFLCHSTLGFYSAFTPLLCISSHSFLARRYLSILFQEIM